MRARLVVVNCRGVDAVRLADTARLRRTALGRERPHAHLPLGPGADHRGAERGGPCRVRHLTLVGPPTHLVAAAFFEDQHVGKGPALVDPAAGEPGEGVLGRLHARERLRGRRGASADESIAVGGAKTIEGDARLLGRRAEEAHHPPHILEAQAGQPRTARRRVPGLRHARRRRRGELRCTPLGDGHLLRRGAGLGRRRCRVDGLGLHGRRRGGRQRRVGRRRHGRRAAGGEREEQSLGEERAMHVVTHSEARVKRRPNDARTAASCPRAGAGVKSASDDDPASGWTIARSPRQSS